jgi:hypothetical protein
MAVATAKPPAATAAAARDVSPRVAHLHIAVDDLPSGTSR